MDKVQAFDVLADALNIRERPIAEARDEIFKLVFDLGGFAFAHGGQGQLRELVVWPESWDLLGCLYTGLSILEREAMTEIHATNQQAFLTERREEAEQDEAAQA